MNIEIEPDTFSTTLQAAKQIVDECKLHLTNSGIQITAVDGSNIAMVDLTLDKTAFETYTVQPRTLGINLKRILTLTNRIANQPTTDNDNNLTLTMGFDQQSRKITLSGGIHDFKMALIDPDSIREEPNIPDFNLGAHITLKKEWLSDGIGAADTLGDSVIFGVDEETQTFYMEASGDTDSWKLEMDTDTGLVSLDAAPARAQYPLAYLKSIKNAIPAKNLISLDLDEDYPMKLHSSIANGDGSVTYNIAPRIAEE